MSELVKCSDQMDCKLCRDKIPAGSKAFAYRDPHLFLLCTACHEQHSAHIVQAVKQEAMDAEKAAHAAAEKAEMARRAKSERPATQK